ncbi:MAG: sigma-E factor negative regulatory protein [Gammaproteobacteria bacterium]|nr:sigma-E factor negative regulatory protein [Gammaproteobacteria bacterium]MDH3749780.1 sigma-E factor negative regulatory protein [Gammaproteobacteria bacterium]MDH3806758.1 sigma-E factor negative regulatory protein [Gammaproteobacteria bacterium]
MNDAIKTQISAFVDGELPQNEAELLLRRLCQDRELRQQAAEYLAMGRVMRGERRVAGMDRLRERISAVLDDKSLQEEFAVAESGAPRYLRPVAGAAIAATVALAAVIGLQQMYAVPDVDPVPGNETIAASVDGSAYTVPVQDDDQLRDYYLRHSATSSYFGANSINARLVTLQLREGVIIDAEDSEAPVDEDEAASTDTVDAQTP